MKKDNIFIISCYSYDSYDYQIMKSPEELTPKEFEKLLHEVQEEEWEKLKEDLKKERRRWINGNDLFSAMIMRLQEMAWTIIEYKEFGFCEDDYYKESEKSKELKKKVWEEWKDEEYDAFHIEMRELDGENNEE